MKNTFSIQLETPLQASLDALAVSMDKSRDWVIEQAIKEYIALQAWQIHAIQDGIDSLDEHSRTTHQTVMIDMANKHGFKRPC